MAFVINSSCIFEPYYLPVLHLAMTLQALAAIPCWWVILPLQSNSNLQKLKQCNRVQALLQLRFLQHLSKTCSVFQLLCDDVNPTMDQCTYAYIKNAHIKCPYFISWLETTPLDLHVLNLSIHNPHTISLAYTTLLLCR